MIEIKSLKKVYGDRTVLDIPYLLIGDGETVVLTGHNGSGKSTLLKILSSVITPTSGIITKVGSVYYLPQQSIAFDKTVEKNVLYSLNNEKANKQKICDEVLEKLNLTALKYKNAKKLSGGETQRLALARVLAKKGDILILDEPTSSADVSSASLIIDTILEYKCKTNCTLIITTHNPSEAKKIGGRHICLTEGKISGKE